GAVELVYGSATGLTSVGSQFLAVKLFAPTPLTATAVSTMAIQLTWQDNSTNETGFLIERSLDGVQFTQIASVGQNVITYTDGGLNANTVYYYRVRAYNAAGQSAYSNVSSDRTGATPAPSNLTATSLAPKQISLSWTDNSPDELGFLIERSRDG